MEESPSGLAGPEYDTTSCQCAGDKDDKKERLYGGYKMIDINVHDDKQERLYGGYKMITTRVPVAATAVRTGRGSVANPGCKPEDAPCQAEESEQFFIRTSAN